MSGMFSAFFPLFFSFLFFFFLVFVYYQTEHICGSTELPLEPSLSRTLIEANESGCLSQALTVVAMLSAETTLLPGRRLVLWYTITWVRLWNFSNHSRCINSSRYCLCLCDSKPNENKRKRDEESNLPDGSGFGDHIQLLQIFECWDSKNYDIRWCKENDLQVDYSSLLSYLFSSIHVKSMVASKLCIITKCRTLEGS